MEPHYKGIVGIQGLGKWSWTCRLTTDTSERISETAVWLELVRTAQLNGEFIYSNFGFAGKVFVVCSFVSLWFLAFFKDEMDVLALTLFCEKMWCLTLIGSCRWKELWSPKWTLLNLKDSNNLLFFSNPMTIMLMELAESFQNKQAIKQMLFHDLVNWNSQVRLNCLIKIFFCWTEEYSSSSYLWLLTFFSP